LVSVSFAARRCPDHSPLPFSAVSVAPPSRTDARRARLRRRRRVAGAVVTALVVLAAGVAVAVATGSSDDDGRPTASVTTDAAAPRSASTSTTGTATTTPATSAPIPAPAIDRRYPVSSFTTTFVDSTRTTSASDGYPGDSSRRLETTFWYPAVVDGGAADRDHGPYPLVLFVHGLGQTAQFYAPLMERWATAGYIVAGPTFPFLSGVPAGPSHVDYDELFGDAALVISRTLEGGNGLPVSGLVDGTRIAAAGHSDGEMVSFTMGFGAALREWRVRSVIAMAGDLSNAGIDPIRDSGLPILHVMETNDQYDPYQHSIDWDRENLTSPRWMLTLLGATHEPPYNASGDPYFELVSDGTVAFLDATLKDHPARLDDLAAAVAAHPDLAALER
jgi:dienelactone hydrolase